MKIWFNLKLILIICVVFVLPLSFNACKGFEGANNLNKIESSSTLEPVEQKVLENLEVKNILHDQVDLSWDVRVNGEYSFSIFRDNVLVGTTENTLFTDIELNQNSKYNYQVYASDLVTGQNYGFASISVQTASLEENNSNQLIFFDDLDTDPISNHWSYLNNVKVSSNNSKSGNRSLEFYFKAGDENTDSHAEARFDLGAKYNELTIVFDLFVPSNFNHRNAPGPDNNKFLRLWTNTYNDLEKVGVSTWSQANGGSAIGEDFVLRQYNSMSTMITSRTDWIAESDRGKWVSVKIYIKVANDQEFGQIKLYKNGSLFHENTQVDNNHVIGEQGLQFGYLLGWANSGFSQDTYMYIDNVAFYSGKIEN